MKPKVFVIMSFDRRFDAVFAKLIKEPLEAAGYDVLRADNFTQQKNILETIIVGIAEAQLVVAEISVLNANVMYELGLSHALRKPTIMLCQSLDDIPFDLKSYRLLKYSTGFDEVDAFKELLTGLGKDHLDGKVSFSNPIIDFWPDEKMVIENAVTPLAEAIDGIFQAEEELEDDRGVMDFVIQGNLAMQEMTDILENTSVSMGAMAEGISSKATKIEEFKAANTPEGAVKMYQLFASAASDINTYAEYVETSNISYSNNVMRFVESYDGIASFTVNGQDQDRVNILQARDTMRSLYNSVVEGLVGLRSFQNSLHAVRGISKDLTRASNRLYKAMEGFIENTEIIESNSLRIMNVLDDKLNS